MMIEERTEVLLLIALLLQSPVKLEISTPKTVFFLGETIPVRLSFTSTRPNEFVVSGDPVGVLSRISLSDQFIVDPATDAEDTLEGLPGQSGGIGTLHAGPAVLSDIPFVSEKILNEWVRFRKPGIFKVHVLSRRVQKAGEHGPQMEVVSNALTLEIRSAPEDWVKEQIDAAVQVLKAPQRPGANTSSELFGGIPIPNMHMPPLDDAAARERFLAARTLRFLDSPEAATQLLLHLNDGMSLDSYSLHLGVLGSPYRSQLLPIMEERLVAVDQPVWEKYLDTLIRLRQLVKGEQKRNEYLTRLNESMVHKQPQARAISLRALLTVPPPEDRDKYVQSNTQTALIDDFPRLSPEMQQEILEDWQRWRVVESPVLIPFLRNIYDTASAPELAEIALIRLFSLAKAEARELVLAQLRTPTKRLGDSILMSLPDLNLPELNGSLAARLEGAQRNEWLIVRYATADIVERVKHWYLRQDENARRASPLVFYFLKFDPTFGEREIRKMLSMTDGRLVFYDMDLRFRDLGSYAWSDTLERLMIEFLSNPIERIQRGAASLLGGYGSSAARKPLWDAMENFSALWRGRDEQLTTEPAREALALERALAMALLGSNAWRIEEEDLQRLQKLCSTDACRGEIVRWRAKAAGN
jgi:hypothetical protein